ncbi:hypothetical protein AX16_002807 [Volvariella volvacea WC 439]|nr:hypothetical protein AX16_002807 [Volvariella volvacea WC 439]
MSSNLYTLDANDCSFGQINENIACIQDEKTRLEAMFDEEMARLKARMEEEIGRLDGQINSLEKLRNNYVPIFRLPPEILREIISIYKLDVEERHDQQMHGSSSYPCQSIYPTYRWIKVTHVCRRLRAVAINYPALWTAIHIPLTPPEWADEVLIRSQPLPLSVLSLGMAVPYPYKGKLPDSSDLLHYLGKDGTARPLHRLHVCLNRPPKIHQSEILWSIFNDLEELSVSSHVTVIELPHLGQPTPARYSVKFVIARVQHIQQDGLGKLPSLPHIDKAVTEPTFVQGFVSAAATYHSTNHIHSPNAPEVP